MHASSNSGEVTTKLPYYDLFAHGNSTGSADERAAVQFHSICFPSIPVLASQEDILKGFASFVAAVVEQEKVAFAVEYLSFSEGGEEQVEKRVVTASTLAVENPHSYESDSTTLTFRESNVDDENDIDFRIRLFSPALDDAMKRNSPRSVSRCTGPIFADIFLRSH